MAGSLAPLERLGGSVAIALESAASGRAHALADASRGFLLHELGSRSRAGRTRATRAWAGGLVLVLLASIALLWNTRRAALTFDVNGAPGVAKTWLAAPRSAPLELHFSEGTSVRLESAARARVVEIDSHGASLSLESGRVRLEVVHRSDSAWKVIAGPFVVTVTGTVFDVSWDPEVEQLSVSVLRGSVAVRESNSGVEQTVSALQTLRTTSAEGRFELSGAEANLEPVAAEITVPFALDTTEPPELQLPSLPSLPTGDNASGGAGEESEPPKKAQHEDAKVGRWREYAKRGALREAFADAAANGFAESCANATAAELLLLGDGARLSGKADRASEALLALRRRFPTDPRGAAAAFALGKVAFDQRGAYEQAAAWFSTSLREQPKGPLARESLGRLIEALLRADDSAGARRAARDYLAKYPEGPHADLARSALY